MAKAREPIRLSEQQLALLALPEEPELVPAAQRWVHNARTTLKDEQRAYGCCELLLQGLGVERIATRLHMSPHTVRAIRRELSAGGKLAGWKERISTAAKDFVTDAVSSLHDDLLEGRMTPQEKSVAVGILADKVAAWDGQAGLVIEHRHEHRISVEKVNGFWSQARPAESAPARSPADVVDVQSVTPAGCSSGCNSALPEPPTDHLLGSGAQAGAPPAEPVGEAGGGGARSSGTGHCPDVLASGEFSAKPFHEE